MSAPLFRRVLGDAFDTLPPMVKAVHSRGGLHRYRGEVEVSRGKHPLARLLAWATRLPPEGKGGVEVEIDADGHGERWTRHIGGHAMASRLWSQDGLLCEKLGLVRFGFRLTVQEGVLAWRVVRVHALGLPLPPRWFHAVRARESGIDGRYRFEVAAAMPVAGLLVHYRGWLETGEVVQDRLSAGGVGYLLPHLAPVNPSPACSRPLPPHAAGSSPAISTVSSASSSTTCPSWDSLPPR